ncbi:class I SAM-dependent methyltransferase [Dyella humicola]|uniref:class I SAM-dependent methyltransferase n=1 Tax=Dyella humicola TaxID=2992126 RepID=UPI00224EA401|nr:class I SAM-dependent methyltransferase [Dyella humicola]
MRSSFVLEEEAPVRLVEKASVPNRWTEFAHFSQRERGLVLLSEESLHLPALTVPREPVLWMRCLRGLPEISKHGISVEIWCRFDGGEARLLVKQHLMNDEPAASAWEMLVDLPLAAGQMVELELRCEGGKRGFFHRADRLGLLGLVVCAREDLPLTRARSHHAWRLKNEIAHFQNVYSGDFYKDRHRDRGADLPLMQPIRPLPPSKPAQEAVLGLRDALASRLSSILAQPGENAFNYAMRVLGTVIPAQAPDFPGRLQALAGKRAGGRLRMLALCAGEAAVEGQILAAAAVPVELCIVDVNAELLERAALQMPSGVIVDRVLGDANDIGPQLGHFDVICITSGLHHLVELEKVLSAIAMSLTQDGEFWLIGEQVGRNGNRLWPEALDLANQIFATWPAEKRINRHTGVRDEVIPDTDFSASCFEGIRSEDITDQLARYFLPVNCYLRNAFLWRLVDVSYAANFDLENADDRALIIQAVVEEAILWAQGSRGTEMHAVYRSKWAGLSGMVNSP